MSKHLDDIRRGLRNPTRHLLILDQFGMPKAVKAELGDLCLWSEVEPLVDELYLLRNKVEWLRQAEHLVIWDGERWSVRHEHGGKAL